MENTLKLEMQLVKEYTSLII